MNQSFINYQLTRRVTIFGNGILIQLFLHRLIENVTKPI